MELFKYFLKILDNKEKTFWSSFRLRTPAARASNINFVNISSFEVTYINCPETVNKLSRFDTLPASHDTLIKVEIKGTCVENAEPAPPYYDILRFCDHKGESTYQGECWCKKGYESKNTFCSGTTTFVKD